MSSEKAERREQKAGASRGEIIADFRIAERKPEVREKLRIVSQMLPVPFDRRLAALPAMSRTPVAQLRTAEWDPLPPRASGDEVGRREMAA